jgi:hypothetical protein
MLDRVRATAAETMDTTAYLADSDEYWGRISAFHKLERRQHFREPGRASWEAFAAGNWSESQAIRERDRGAVEAEFAEDARSGLASYRVRVVELPVTPYLHWELTGLKIRAECGENIRVVGSDAVTRFETEHIVPELIFMGTEAMYEVCYDEAGTLSGGRKFTDATLVTGCLSVVQALHADGEDLLAFFEREIAPLPPSIPAPEPRTTPKA